MKRDVVLQNLDVVGLVISPKPPYTIATSPSGVGGQAAGLEFTLDGGGVAITAGIKGDVEIPFAATIAAVRLLADQSGSLVVDLWKDSYANFPPVVGDSICGSAKPTLSSASKSEDTTLTGWTTTVAAGDIIRVNVVSAATVTRALLSLTLVRS